MSARSKVALAALTLLSLASGLPPAGTALAADPGDEPRFQLQVDHKGRGQGFSYESTGLFSFRLCDMWDGGRWGVAPTGAGAGPSLLDDLGISLAAGAGMPGQQSAGSPRALLALRRSLVGLKLGEALPFCLERSVERGSDGHGSTVTGVVDESGAFRASGVVVSGTTRRPFSTSSPPNGDPGQNAVAQLVRTATGARFTFSPGNGAAAEDTDIGMIDVGSTRLDPAQERTLTGFDLTERELADWPRLSRSSSVTGRGEVGQVTVLLQLTVEQPDLGEVMVEAEGYDTWRPEGDLRAPDQPGNQLRVRAWVEQSGPGEKRLDRKVTLTFELTGVSKVAGVCNNGPAEGAGFEPDLRFLQDRNPTLEVKSDEAAETRGPVSEAAVVVSSYDYGAWGQLKVTAVDSKKRKVPVTIKGREGKVGAALLLPKDEDNNRIADVWQEAHGVFGKTGTTDEEKLPYGNGFHGDGLTLYEEYRGFQVRGEWIDTDPERKDLFVCDQTGFATEGILLFEAASELVVHQVTCRELGEERIINRHATDGSHVVSQHGLRIERGGGVSPVNEGDEAGPPRTSRRILLPAAASGDARGRQEMVSDMAHELAHGVGIQHHGDLLYSALYRWVKTGEEWHLTVQNLKGDADTPFDQLQPYADSKPERIRVLRESDRSALRPGQPPPPGFTWAKHLDGYVGYETAPGGVTSGDDGCLVRYQEKGTYLSTSDASLRWIPDGKDWRPRTTLCGSPAGAGVNATGRSPQPRSGDAARGNCKGQLVVNDRYQVPRERAKTTLPGDAPLPGAGQGRPPGP